MSLVQNIIHLLSTNNVIAPDSGIVPLFIFNGESNSGGRALNSDATGPELAARSSVRILNNTTLLFEDLDIGTNNLIGHVGLGMDLSTIHGWELGLANDVESGTFTQSQVFLVKTGQGGSTIAQWADGLSYWDTAKARIDAAMAINPSFFPILFYSQGINDAVGGTSTATWKAATAAHWAKIRARYGADMPIICTKFMTAYSTFSTALDEVVASTANCWSIVTEDLPLQDGAHWNYSGMKSMATRMINKLKENYTI